MSNGRPQEAIVVLRAIAKYNNNIMNISSEDVHLGEAPASGDRPLVMKVKDKKDSEAPSPAGDEFDERQRLPGTAGLSPDGSSSTVMYDSITVGPPPYDNVGKGLPPRRSHPMRTGSAFYAETPVDDGAENLFERSFAAGRMASTEEERDEDAGFSGGDRNALLSPALRRSLESQLPVGKEPLSRSRTKGGMFAWWFSWMDQLGKLFVPQWRRTVLLMWVIWGSMSFGKLPDARTPKLTRSVYNVQRMAACGIGI